MQTPQIDKRTVPEIVAETETLAQELSGWQPPAIGKNDPVQTDPGQALIRVFGHFAGLVVDRLNRAPEKNFLSFLNLIGTEPEPPRPARVPLTFQLASGSPVDALVPAGVQAAAPPVTGEEVIFETEQDLIVTRAKLQAVIARDTFRDRYGDHTAVAVVNPDQPAGQDEEPFAPFSGNEPTAHELYVACDSLLVQPGAKDVTLLFQSPDDWQWLLWSIQWSYWDGESWQPTASSTEVKDGAWRVSFLQLPEVARKEINGVEAGWLRAKLAMPMPPGKADFAPDAVAFGNKNPEQIEGAFYPFPATSTVPSFHISAKQPFSGGGSVVRLHVKLEQSGTVGGGANELRLEWHYKEGDKWKFLGQSSAAAPQVGDAGFGLHDGTHALTQDGEIRFHVPVAWPSEIHRSHDGRWLRAKVVQGDTGKSGAYATPPKIESLSISYDWALPRVTSVSGRLDKSPPPPLPSKAYFNSRLIDLSKDFNPFGVRPDFNDTFYIACPKAQAQAGRPIKLHVTLTNPNPVGAAAAPIPPVNISGRPVIAWEAWDGKGWANLDRSDYAAKTAFDDSRAFTQSGDIALTLPDTFGPTVVNGESGHWVRARLVGGHYGKAATYKETTVKVEHKAKSADKVPDSVTEYPGSAVVAATYAAPVLKSVRFEAVGAAQTEIPATASQSHNDFVYVDHTAVMEAGEPFTPFTLIEDCDPALYLGFDRPFDPRPISLYLQMAPPKPEDVADESLAEVDPDSRPQIVWEYAGRQGWTTLNALDETETLAARGLVQFVGPKHFRQRQRFDQQLYWLRARWHSGEFPLPPRIQRILPNTTWASQGTSVADEILGSSNGNSGQTFKTVQMPVQPGQQLVVRERERPAPAAEAALVALEGEDAVNVVLDESEQPIEIWVRWHQVSDFYQSAREDRHYTIDALTGDIRFGDGIHGMVPPKGQNNIRISYRTGGGDDGNQSAASVVALKSGLPYIDSVINHEAAAGGAPRESIARLQERGPRQLRHRDRVITAQDLEDLTLAASPDVARVRALLPTFHAFNLWLDKTAKAASLREHEAVDAGRIGVIVVPQDDVPQPTPSLSLLRQVKSYLQARCPATAELWVAGPEWIQISIDVTLVPTDLRAADVVESRVRTALDNFLHPLHGGAGGQGWAFGRKPHRSDLYALIENVAGVDHLLDLQVAHDPQTSDSELQRELVQLLGHSLQERAQSEPAPELTKWLNRSLVYTGKHEIIVTL